MLATLELRRRQDLLSYLMQFVIPKDDTLEVEVRAAYTPSSLLPSSLPPFLLLATSTPEGGKRRDLFPGKEKEKGEGISERRG